MLQSAVRLQSIYGDIYAQDHKRMTITVEKRVFDKIEFVQKNERIKSVSSMTSRLIEEALEHYDDPDEPRMI